MERKNPHTDQTAEPCSPSPPPRVLYYRWREPNPEEDGEVLRISTEKPLGTTEDSVDRSRDDSVDRRQVPETYRLEPPDEFQFPPQRVPEPVSLASRINPEVPVSEPEMEDLSDTLLHPPERSDTLMNPSPAEVNDERGNDLADQVSLTENEAGQNRDDRVERRRVPAACRADPPDEFQFPPERVPEPGDQTSRTDRWFQSQRPRWKIFQTPHCTRQIFLTHQWTLAQQKPAQRTGVNHQTRSTSPQTPDPTGQQPEREPPTAEGEQDGLNGLVTD